MFVKADKRNSLSRFKADNINGKVCVENDEIWSEIFLEVHLGHMENGNQHRKKRHKNPKTNNPRSRWVVRYKQTLRVMFISNNNILLFRYSAVNGDCESVGYLDGSHFKVNIKKLNQFIKFSLVYREWISKIGKTSVVTTLSCQHQGESLEVGLR